MGGEPARDGGRKRGRGHFKKEGVPPAWGHMEGERYKRGAVARGGRRRGLQKGADLPDFRGMRDGEEKKGGTEMREGR